MARYKGPVCRLCRREGEKLYLKGQRCYTDKCAIDRRSYPPGEHGRRRNKPTEYGMQLREKQKVKRIYGILEKQFKRYFDMAEKMPGVTGENFLSILERRLDNVVYRLGLATSRNEARQFVLHGHILVNGRKVNIPSYLVDEGDVISVKDSSRKSKRFKEVFEFNEDLTPPKWLSVNLEKAEGKVVAMPTREDIDYPVEEHLIVEFYSR
ncbi:30S ribosomal protein S4 [Halothermothrix orenii]|uniref:Small ribosomal subunit protein uS4 n=1 Tax=Halothermothrix orenii (strain H 168 / OCM 544 / DSM 9562) TaxID=373903 RepID=RS4_HALOH|nr:30S ribosomal protein S4 [Halothermothrix orenii]B8D0T6.1 RecName: Full=Small ribosomal subunit protein uS4; AltName: Full=30S ribosomal protein S4 [Halothermothrix orenii H 168]ACL68905.1 ribosomal protein S4 [Halothermothrix orenii H 168]